MIKTFVKSTLIAGVLVSGIGFSPIATAEAGAIERACMSSGRSKASNALCGCIQRVADQHLTNSDQRMAAKFFRNPQKAQDIRQSDRSSHETFWRKYKVFGTAAQNSCG
ncbi:hypothetical protein AQS8620_03138 [Aquimixticola soesokkakensis]|uniref:Arginine transporter n=1 Tax=Aquimixticola soesokkakensis TaxID=1519096 RepID=A0A1Y5TMT4_9RHOB|nr:hypothetical protein [Aquimixticola soesokkakensis]SLN67275.1 hypothetical protein AQS8620_03138 [Aquimixticola soesokkakensis]